MCSTFANSWAMHPHTQVSGNCFMFWDQLATISFWSRSLLWCVDLWPICLCAPRSAAKTDYLPERHMTRFLPLWHVFFWNFPSGHDLSLQWVSILEVLHVLPKSSNHKQNQQFVYRQLKPGPTQTSQKMTCLNCLSGFVSRTSCMLLSKVINT